MGRQCFEAQERLNGANGAAPILEVKDLKTHFFTDKGVVQRLRVSAFELANRRWASSARAAAARA